MTTVCPTPPPPGFPIGRFFPEKGFKEAIQATPGPVAPGPAGGSRAGDAHTVTRNLRASSKVPVGPSIDQWPSVDQGPGCPTCRLSPPTPTPVLSLGGWRDQPVPPWPSGTTWANNDPFRSLALTSWASCQGR